MPDVICDTSTLQYLHQIGKLDLLKKLYGQVSVPRAVVTELEEGHRRGVKLPNLRDLPWLKIREVRDQALLPFVTRLGNGEKEVLALGRESMSSLLLLDDREVRRHAQSLGLDVSGTVGTLLLAKRLGHVEAIGPLLDRLEGLGFRLRKTTRNLVLQLSGEQGGGE